MSSSPRSFPLLLILAIAMFTSFLGRREFAASHEARVAQVAREMAESGWAVGAKQIEVPAVHLTRKQGVLRLASDPDAPALHVNPWIVPVLNGEIRLQKPPLPYWGAAIAYRLAGVSEATSRVVPALLGVLATLLLLDLARVLYGQCVAWAATLIWLTTFLVAEQYRLAMADPYLAVFTLAAIWSWIKACPNAHARYILVFYLSLALGALAKGPLVFLLAFIPLTLFHLCFRERMPRGWRSHTVGILLFAAVALPWPLAVLRQVPNATELWRYESVGEVSGENLENVRGWWYYLINLPLMSAPWVPMWLYAAFFPFLGRRWLMGALRRASQRLPMQRPSLAESAKGGWWQYYLSLPANVLPRAVLLVFLQSIAMLRRRSQAFFPLLWYVVTIGFFSIAGQKKLPYLLPMLPAQALMLGIAIVPLLRLARRVRMRRLPGALILIQTLVAAAFVVAVPVLAGRAHSLTAGALIFAALGVLFTIVSVREMLAVHPGGWLLAQSLAYVFVLLGFGTYYLTPINNARSPAPVVREVAGLADGNHTAILMSHLPEEASFYLPLHPPSGPAPSVYLVIVDDGVEVERRGRAKHSVSVPPADQELFQSWLPGAKIISIRRLDLNTAPGDARWKAYEIVVQRTVFARNAHWTSGERGVAASVE